MKYSISIGRFIDNSGNELPGNCYSGQPEAMNDPDRTKEARIGPLPMGKYRIGRAYKHPTKGPIVMRLTPYPETEMFGRAGMLIHGDSIHAPGTASNGCIIAPRELRMRIEREFDKTLEVVR